MFVRALLAFLALPGVVAFAVPIGWLVATSRTQPVYPLGLVLLAVGCVALLWCVRDFYVSGKGTLAPWSPPVNLVVVGLYRYTRNPMYVAVALILLGWAISFAAPGLLIYAVIVALAFHLRVVLAEEPWLARKHGGLWQEYSEPRSTVVLVISDDPAWPLVQEWIAAASNRVEVLPVNEPDRRRALEEMQITTRSPMGAVIYETGGILIDGGWLRILGSGHPRLPRTLPGWNKGRIWSDERAAPPMLVVADDVVGGSFAINGGALDGPQGHVHYFAPDSLEWESLDRGYTDFLLWALQGDLAKFYEGQRWPEWPGDVAALGGDQAFSIYPFLWTKGPPIGERSRRAVPMAELFELQFEFRRQLSA